ncbi:TIGR02391 family protein [Trichormus sp. NMC-1]|uniref:TIGR02391 family protein n=1 Tax=Trichormus sp. NMC-1 TaxID=1853259 RepID=UPI0008DC1930|nr:TIGR02391 family protein [Trichormus sp. NMC-1]
MYNLTETQKIIAQWLVKSVRDRKLEEEFTIYWIETFETSSPQAAFFDWRGTEDELKEVDLTQGALNALNANDLLYIDQNISQRWKCTLKGKIYEAVDEDFNAPDTSFLKYLSPLTDISGFDKELKQRCLPILSAGGADPMLWDSAVRTAGVILEERLRDVGSISDPNRTGRNLVNDVFGNNGTLALKFTVSSERDGYRELYSGVVGAFRNPSAHRLIDPSPEEGGAFIVFVNLLLVKLEALR